MTPANESKNTARETKPRSVEDLAYLVRLHGRTLEMNGAKTSPVLLRAAAEAVAKYEAAKAAQNG